MVQAEHFCASDLWDDAKGEYRKSIFKIVKIAQGTIVGQKGRKKGLPFLTLEDAGGKVQRAPFGANPTNCTSIANALGTPDAKKWVGCWIGLYVTKVDSPEGLVDAIRVHPQRVQPPGQKPADQKSEPPAGKDITRNEVEAQLKADGFIDETSKERVEQIERESREQHDRAKERVERAIGRSVDDNPQLTEAEMRAIELAEAEEARRGKV